MDRIEKDWTDLDCSEVDFDCGNWSWGRGGSPLQDWDYSITYVASDTDLTETRYKLPECLSLMLRRSEQHGAEDAKRTIRNAIGQ